MRYYLILEEGFTRAEYNAVRHLPFSSTETAAIDEARGYFDAIFREERDAYGRYCITGINKQGFSATIAILAD